MIRNALAVGFALSLISTAAWADATVHTVDQAKMQFSVAELTIKQGDTVKFTNSDRPAHNILVSDGTKVLNSGLQQPGEPFEVPFPQKGRFTVTCGIHPKMSMTVIVE
jgi:plastocyanin